MPSQPTIVFEWKDSEPTGAIGWYVVDKIINGVTGGGIFMRPEATKQEVADIAANMTKKFTVTSPQIGGGKGGIRFSSTDPRARQVLRRYIIAMKQLFQTFVVTAGDFGVDDALVEQIFHEDLGLPTCQNALAVRIAEATGKPNLASQLARIIAFPANGYFPMIEAAVGYGCCEAIRTVQCQMSIRQHRIPSQRVVIQGFGAVGSSLAYYLEESGYKIVGISDKDGFICHKAGLDINDMLAKRKARLETTCGDAVRQDVAKTIVKTMALSNWQTENEDEGGFICMRGARWSDEEFLLMFLDAAGKAEVFCPCAGRYAVTKNVANTLVSHTCVEVVASGANNPFGSEDGRKEDESVADLLVDHDVVVIRDAICNSGTAQLFHRGLSCQFDLTEPNAATKILQACAQPIKDFLHAANRRIRYPVELLAASTELIAYRVAYPIAMEDMDKPLPLPQNEKLAVVVHASSSASSKPATNKQEESKALGSSSSSLAADRAEYQHIMHQCVVLGADPAYFMPERLRNRPELAEVISSDDKKEEEKEKGETVDEEKKETVMAVVNRHARYAFPRLLEFVPGYEDVEKRIKIILELGAECVEPAELSALMHSETADLVAYDGFEPSGRIHVAQALMKKAIVNKMTKCGFTYIFWLADFFAMLNLKQGGDMNKIRILGRYFQEVWKACGMDMTRVKFLWAYDEILKRPAEYFQLMLDISTKFSLARVRKCSTALGRQEDEANLQSSQIVYPILQCADIFFLGVNVCQLGMDQRKVNMLARDFVDANSNLQKPIVLSHTMLPGLAKGQAKMSKSNPDSAIYMDDAPEVVESKIRKAYCPGQETKDNPCLAYFKHIVFPNVEVVSVDIHEHDKDMRVEYYASYQELEDDYIKGVLYPNDLKTALSHHLNVLIEPVRTHFRNDPEAHKLLAEVREKCV